MRRSKYAGCLSVEARSELQALVSTGTHPARHIRRARILLLANRGKAGSEICELLGVSMTAVDRVRRRARSEGVRAAITDRPRSGRPKKLTDRDEAKVVALARSKPPAGFARWAHRALTEKLHEDEELTCRVGRETVRAVLKRHKVKPWKKGRTGASPA